MTYLFDVLVRILVTFAILTLLTVAGIGIAALWHRRSQ